MIPNKGPWNNYQELLGLQTKQLKGEGTLKVFFFLKEGGWYLGVIRCNQMNGSEKNKRQHRTEKKAIKQNKTIHTRFCCTGLVRTFLFLFPTNDFKVRKC